MMVPFAYLLMNANTKYVIALMHVLFVSKTNQNLKLFST